MLPEDPHNSAPDVKSRSMGSAGAESSGVDAAFENWIGDQLRVTIDGYQLLERIGEGGQAVVYRARRARDGREVAVKVLRGGALASDQSRRRLEREARSLASMSHPNIVGILEHGQSVSGYSFIVMPYVPGGTILDYARSASAITQSQIVRLFARICRAVGYAHLNGITHRDLSPANIRIDPAGEPHILDFGLAALSESPAAATALTSTGQFLGSIAYASPEQASGSSVDPRTDVYALGVILYQLLSGGRSPYPTSGAVMAAMHHIVHTPPTPLTAWQLAASMPPPVSASGASRSVAGPAWQISPVLEAIVLKALAKRPGDRYPDANALAEDLERFLLSRRAQASSAASPPPLPAKPAAPTHASPTFSRPALAAGVGGFLIVLLLGIAVLASIGPKTRANSARGPNPVNTLPKTQPDRSAQSPPRVVPQVTGEATLEYWKSLATVCQRIDGGLNSQSSSPSQTSGFLRTQAQHIEDLRVAQVDREALTLAREIAGMLRSVASLVDRFNIDREGVLTILHFVIDAEGLSEEVLEQMEEIKEVCEHIDSQSRLIRASLSSRFGTEFPHLFP